MESKYRLFANVSVKQNNVLEINLEDSLRLCPKLNICKFSWVSAKILRIDRVAKQISNISDSMPLQIRCLLPAGMKREKKYHDMKLKTLHPPPDLRGKDMDYSFL